MTVFFGNQEECHLPWANGYRLGSIRWNREIINHDINVGIRYPELTPPTLPFEHLPLSTDPKNLPESARAGRMTIPILWTSNNNQVIITEGNPQTISFQQGMIAQTIEIQWAADHEHFIDTEILTFESIDLENTHVDFIGYRNSRSHPERHTWTNDSQILRIPKEFQLGIWEAMNQWKGNDSLQFAKISLVLEEGTLIEGYYQRERRNFEFEFSRSNWIKLLQHGGHEDNIHRVTLRIENRSKTRSFTVTGIEIDKHQFFHEIPMLNLSFVNESVHYTEAIDGIDVDYKVELDQIDQFDMNLIRFIFTTNYNDTKKIVSGDKIAKQIEDTPDQILSFIETFPRLPTHLDQYEIIITPKIKEPITNEWITLYGYSFRTSLALDYPKQPSVTWGDREVNWKELMRDGGQIDSLIFNNLSLLPEFPDSIGMKTQLFFRENSRRLDVITITCEEFINPEEWITEWVVLNPFSRYKYPDESTEYSLYQDRQRIIEASIFIPNSQSKDWVITKPITYDTRNGHMSEYDFMNGRYGVNNAIHACEKTGLHLLIFAPENSLEWDDEDMTYQNLVELLNGSEINDFDYGFVEIIPKED